MFHFQTKMIDFLYFKLFVNNKPIDKDVNLKEIVFSESTQGYSGADLSMLLREASILAIKRSKDINDLTIKQNDFHMALKKVFPSVSKKDELVYAKLERSLKNIKAHLETE